MPLGGSAEVTAEPSEFLEEEFEEADFNMAMAHMGAVQGAPMNGANGGGGHGMQPSSEWAPSGSGQ